MSVRCRTALAAAAGVTLAGVAGGVAIGAALRPKPEPTLHQSGVQLARAGARAVAVDEGRGYETGSRVLAGGPVELVRAQATWLAAGSVPDAGYREMCAGALLDLHTLTWSTGGTVAGWTGSWRYVWPRDASFVAVALAATGHLAEAESNLVFVQGLRTPGEAYEARFLPDGSGPVADGRLPQTDGSGWTLWAADVVLAAVRERSGATAERAALTRLEPLVLDGLDFLSRATRGGKLPPPSPDYWERAERATTLGTAATALIGLEAGARALRRAGTHADVAALAERTAQPLRARIERRFGPRYPRYPGRRARDAATAFLLPPFLERPLPGARTAWLASFAGMARPAGGLAPGEGWREPSVSWTPQTSLYAWTAARNDAPERARALLDWLAAHRTRHGALPEKVRADGGPAGPAPLAWTSANVVLAVAALEAGSTR